MPFGLPLPELLVYIALICCVQRSSSLTRVLGPVLIDFPIDILFSPVDRIDKIAWGALTRPLPSLPAPSLSAIKDAVELWKAAERPVIIASTGAHGSEVRSFSSSSRELIVLTI